MQCYADYYVVHVEPVNNITTYSYNPGGVNGPTIPTWGTIAAVSGVHSGGTIHIVYSSKNRTNTLRKPLIVVENMDGYNLAPQVQTRPYTITEFIKDLSEPGTSFDFNSQLDDVAGYDLVFINFNDGMDGIVRNAAVVQEAINRVNINKVFDTRSGQLEQNVVLGMGTGGLNARYALANMAKNFSGSNTRLLITHDAPHRGQNIAVGLQYLVKFINKSTAYSYNLGDVFPEHGQTLTYFKSKVCKDVLIYQTSDNDNSVAANSFINNVYQPMVTFAANAQPYQFIATSLGNECARPLFEAGRKFMDFGSQLASGVKLKATLSLFIGRSRRFERNLFSIPLSELKYETVVFARSIPNQNDPARLITAFTYLSKLTLVGGLVNVTKNGVDEVAYASSNLLPIDGVAGSFNTLMDFSEMKTYQKSFGNLSFSYEDYIATILDFTYKRFITIKISLYGFFKASMYNSEIFNTNYTSLPVGSALDVSPFNANTFTQKYVNGTNQNYPSKSNTFIAQETVTSQSLYNNSSMRFTARNARFLYNEMENLANRENCSNECFNPYFITGESIICSNGSYFIQGIPRGTNVVWSASPSGIVSITANGPSATLTKISDGVITLTATISNACTVGNVSINMTVVIGTPVPEGIYGPNNDLCYNGRASESEYFSVPNSTNLLTYFWQINGVGSDIGPGILVNPFRWGIGMHEIKVRSYSATCGYSAWYTSSFNVIDCNNFRMFSASPNPTTGDVQIENTSKDKSSVIKEIQVTDKYGNLKRQFKVFGSPKKYNISIREFPADMYIIRIYDGKTWISRKVFKN